MKSLRISPPIWECQLSFAIHGLLLLVDFCWTGSEAQSKVPLIMQRGQGHPFQASLFSRVELTISYIEIHLYFEFAFSRLDISNKIYKIIYNCLVSFGDDFCYLPGLAHVTWRPGCQWVCIHLGLPHVHILVTHTHTISMCAHISCVWVCLFVCMRKIVYRTSWSCMRILFCKFIDIYVCHQKYIYMFKPDELSPGKLAESTEIHSIQRACPLDNGYPSLSEKRHKAVVGGVQKTHTPYNLNRTTDKHKSRRCVTIFWSMTGLAWGSAGWVGKRPGSSHHSHYSVRAERQQRFIVSKSYKWFPPISQG